MAAKKRNIVLCGFMATGKSSVGRRLAEMLRRDFLDMDSMIETEEGMSIAQIFASRGEPAFRALEAGMVERVARRKGCVIAAGGGTIVNERNLRRLKRSGIVVTLTADIKTILERVGAAEDRPLLRGENKAERIRRLLREREQAYAKADIVIDTSSKGIDEVAQSIIDRLPEQKSGQRRI
jgi:shikimate kinase